MILYHCFEFRVSGLEILNGHQGGLQADVTKYEIEGQVHDGVFSRGNCSVRNHRNHI